MDQNPSKERFLEETKNHKLLIIKDDGIYRHLRMKSDSFNMYYEIITYPEGLLIRGDMGTFIFERTEDMFQFFNSGINKDGEISINSGYWEEKCQTSSNFGAGIKEFDSDKFLKHVKDDFESYFDNGESEEKNQVWEEIEDQILSVGHNENELQNAINNFDIQSYINTKFSFECFWEHSYSKYSFHFIWCLYAIVLAIKEYNLTKKIEVA